VDSSGRTDQHGADEAAEDQGRQRRRAARSSATAHSTAHGGRVESGKLSVAASDAIFRNGRGADEGGSGLWIMGKWSLSFDRSTAILPRSPGLLFAPSSV